MYIIQIISTVPDTDVVGKKVEGVVECHGLRVLVDTRLSPTITLWCLGVKSMYRHWASS